MEQVLIRKATLKDIDILLRFEQGVISAERPFDSTLKPDPVQYYDLEQLILSPDVEMLVAEYNDELIGSGYARIEIAKPYLVHSRFAYLGFMYVTPDLRGKGVNKKILEALKQWALARQVTEMRLEVYYENQPAIKAYEKAGFAKHMIEMRLGL